MNPDYIISILYNNVINPLFVIAFILLIIKVFRGLVLVFGDDYINKRAKILLTSASIFNFLSFISLFQVLLMLYSDYFTKSDISMANLVSFIFIMICLAIFATFLIILIYHMIDQKFIKHN